VLDGGWDAWRRSRLPTSPEVPIPSPWQFEGRPDPSMIIDAATLQTHLDSGVLRLIDARSPDRFRGENETIDPVAGHIPGARNRFFKDNLDAEGRFRSGEQLREAFDSIAAGGPASEIINQCGSGVTACHNLLALEIAGLAGARLYPGSWSEWCSDPLRPVETG